RSPKRLVVGDVARAPHRISATLSRQGSSAFSYDARWQGVPVWRPGLGVGAGARPLRPLDVVGSNRLAPCVPRRGDFDLGAFAVTPGGRCSSPTNPVMRMGRQPPGGGRCDSMVHIPAPTRRPSRI